MNLAVKAPAEGCWSATAPHRYTTKLPGPPTSSSNNVIARENAT